MEPSFDLIAGTTVVIFGRLSMLFLTTFVVKDSHDSAYKSEAELWIQGKIITTAIQLIEIVTHLRGGSLT